MMRWTDRLMVSLVVWIYVGGLALAATPPAKVVEQFIELHIQGRFAEARALTLGQANLSASLFSNWIFGTGGADLGADTADIFLSRKFAQSFHYTITGTAQSGENQAYVTAVRSSPNMTHLFTWALAPKRGAAPYEIIEAIDTYLAKVNFPVEESRLQFTLIRDVDIWHIAAIRDERFVQFQQQFPLQAPLSVAAQPYDPTVAPGSGAPAGPPPVATTTSSNPGRQMADAQFYATLQSFNSTYRPGGPGASAPEAPQEEKRSFFSRIFGSRKGSSQTVAAIGSKKIETAFLNIRDAIGRYAAGNNDVVPNETLIYDWKSLREFVHQYGSKQSQLPSTETDAGFSFVSYRVDPGGGVAGNYTLMVELHQAEDGTKRLEVTPYGVDRVK